MTIYTDKFEEIYRKSEYTNPSETDFPLVLNLELKAGRGEFMNPAIFYKAIDEARDRGAEGIRFQGNGDPLAHRNIISFIHVAKREMLLSALTTPGYLLYLAVDSLCNSGLHTFNLTILPDKYNSAKRSLEVLFTRRKENPFIRVSALYPDRGIDKGSVERDFSQYCDEFNWQPQNEWPKYMPKVYSELRICWDGVVLHGLESIGSMENSSLYDLWGNRNGEGKGKTKETEEKETTT